MKRVDDINYLSRGSSRSMWKLPDIDATFIHSLPYQRHNVIQKTLMTISQDLYCLSFVQKRV